MDVIASLGAFVIAAIAVLRLGWQPRVLGLLLVFVCGAFAAELLAATAEVLMAWPADTFSAFLAGATGVLTGTAMAHRFWQQSEFDANRGWTWVLWAGLSVLGTLLVSSLFIPVGL